MLRIKNLFIVMLLATASAHAALVDDLVLAVWKGKADEVQSILARGVDINAVGNGDETALMRAAVVGDTDMLELLINHDADVNIANSKGHTALMMAVNNKRLEATEFLLDNAADVNAASTFGTTVLMYAAGQGNAEIVELLIERGADKEAKNKGGQTAGQYAIEAGHSDTAALLAETATPAEQETAEVAIEHKPQAIAEISSQEAPDHAVQDIERETPLFVTDPDPQKQPSQEIKNEPTTALFDETIIDSIFDRNTATDTQESVIVMDVDDGVEQPPVDEIDYSAEEQEQEPVPQEQYSSYSSHDDSSGGILGALGTALEVGVVLGAAYLDAEAESERIVEQHRQQQEIENQRILAQQRQAEQERQQRAEEAKRELNRQIAERERQAERQREQQQWEEEQLAAQQRQQQQLAAQQRQQQQLAAQQRRQEEQLAAQRQQQQLAAQRRRQQQLAAQRRQQQLAAQRRQQQLAAQRRQQEEQLAAQRQQQQAAQNAQRKASRDRYGAISVSQIDGGGYAWGIAWDYVGAIEAEIKASNECRSRGGVFCEKAAWAFPWDRNTCSAVAIGDDGHGAGWGGSKAEAQQVALNDCRVFYQNCRNQIVRCAN